MHLNCTALLLLYLHKTRFSLTCIGIAAVDFKLNNARRAAARVAARRRRVGVRVHELARRHKRRHVIARSSKVLIYEGFFAYFDVTSIRVHFHYIGDNFSIITFNKQCNSLDLKTMKINTKKECAYVAPLLLFSLYKQIARTPTVTRRQIKV